MYVSKNQVILQDAGSVEILCSFSQTQSYYCSTVIALVTDIFLNSQCFTECYGCHKLGL